MVEMDRRMDISKVASTTGRRRLDAFLEATQANAGKRQAVRPDSFPWASVIRLCLT
jgi:hypothetical protein